MKLQHFFPAPDKVRQAEFHPVQPWLLTCTKSDLVTLYNWSSKQVMHEFQLGSPEDDMLTDVDMCQSDPMFQQNPSVVHSASSTSRSSTGHVRDVRFLDLDTAYIQIASQHALLSGTTGEPQPSVGSISALHGRRLLVVVCELKVLIYDLQTHHVMEVGKIILEGTKATCVSFLFLGGVSASASSGGVMSSPVLAIGCSDGMVRLVQLSSMKLMGRLVSSHKSSIACITASISPGSTWEQVIVGHLSGSMVRWEPFARGTGNGDHSATDDNKGHEKEVVGIGFACTREAADMPSSVLFSCSIDNRIMGWDRLNHNLCKFKIDSKMQVTCFAINREGFVTAGSQSLYVGTEMGQVLSVGATSGAVRSVCNLNNMIPHGAKKHPKLYGISFHPSLPNLVCLAANAGTAVMTLGVPSCLPVSPLPLRSPMQALAPPGSTPEAIADVLAGLGDFSLNNQPASARLPASEGATFISAAGNALILSSAVLQDEDRHFMGTERPARVKILRKDQMSSNAVPSGPAVISSSYDGAFVSAVFPAAGQYTLYRSAGSTWTEVASGLTSSSIAWHCSEYRFAIYEKAAPMSAPAPQGKAPKKGSKAEREYEAARKAADDAAAITAAAASSVQVRTFDAYGSMSVAVRAVDVGSDSAAAMMSGPLLAVTYNRTLTEPHALVLSSSAPRVMQFHTWDTGHKIGPEFPEPSCISWDPSLEFCAMAYSSQVLIFSVQPSFRVVMSVAVAGASSMQWAMRQLYMLTPTQISLLFISVPPVGSDPSVGPSSQLVTLAASGHLDSAASCSSGILPSPFPRPPGQLALLGPRDGALWMVNVHGQPVALPLSHPGLRACSLIASGDAAAAITLATSLLTPTHHDQLASFLSDMDGMTGAASALALPGLTLPVETRLRMQARQWPQCLEAVEALLAGYTHRPPPGQFVYSASTAAYQADSAGTRSFRPSRAPYGMGGALDASLFASASAPEPVAPAGLPLGIDPVDDVDWSKPLREVCTTQLLCSSRSSAQAGLSRHANIQQSMGFELGLQLLSHLMPAGLHDVARHACRLLLQYSTAASSEQLSHLAGYMSQVGMKSELEKELSWRMVPGAEPATRETTGLMASLLSGNTASTQAILQQSSAIALAATHAASHRLVNAAASLAAWNSELCKTPTTYQHSLGNGPARYVVASTSTAAAEQ